MSIEGQCHFFTIYFPGFVCFVIYKAIISGEGLQDHWSSGLLNPLHLLHATRTIIKSGLSLKLSLIGPCTAKLAAIERLKKSP